MKEILLNNKKKIIFFLCICLVIVILVYKILQTYAVFYSEMNGAVNVGKGKWVIKVNNKDITQGTDNSFTIDSVQADANSHVKEGNLAPGLSGSFEIVIDPSQTDVSIRYDVTLNTENMTNKSITINNISEISQGNSLVKTGENTYSAIIPLDQIKNSVVNTLKVTIEWTDSRK